MKSMEMQLLILFLTIVGNIAVFGQANPPTSREEWIAFAFAAIGAVATNVVNFLLGRKRTINGDMSDAKF